MPAPIPQDPLALITPRQRLTLIFAALLLFAVIVEMVRRQRLREEYAWLWIGTATLIVVFALRLNWLVGLTHLLGAEVTASGAYFLGLLFLVFINLHFSIKNSEMAGRIKTLAQRIGLLEAEIRELRDEKRASDGRGEPADERPRPA